jgi:hypothetical protein
MGEAEDSELFTFDQILEREPYVLSDAEPVGCTHRRWYEEGVYNSSDFSQMDQRLLRTTNNDLQVVRTWFADPKVHTTSKVIAEIDRFRQILHDKQAMLNTAAVCPNSRRRKKYSRPDYSLDFAECSSLFGDICFKYVNTVRSARRNVFNPSDPDVFSAFEQFVVEAADEWCAKRDFVPRGEQCFKKNEDLHADEELVAAALYRSFFDNERSCIVSPDSDIARIVIAVCKKMQGTVWSYSANDSMKRYPVRVYFVVPGAAGKEEKYRLQFDTRDFKHRKRTVREQYVDMVRKGHYIIENHGPRNMNNGQGAALSCVSIPV